VYTEDQLLTAIAKATEEINDKTFQIKDYVRGYNDCFAFLVCYEKHLRKEKSRESSLHLVKGYHNQEGFFDSLNLSGYTSLEDLAKVMLFEPVKNRVPQTGDIAYEERQSIGSAMIAEKDYWVSTTENKQGVKKRRKLLFKELRPILLARPVYI